MRLDVQARVRVREDVCEDLKHHCCYCRGNDGDQGSEEGQDEHGDGAEGDEGASTVREGSRGCELGAVGAGCDPVFDGLGWAGGDGQRADEDHDEVEDGGGEEEAEHPVGDGFGEVEGPGDAGGEGD